MTEECVRFIPPEVQGIPDVSEVAIFSDRVEVQTASIRTTFRFENVAKRQEAILISWLKRLVGKAPFPLVVGEREFCTKRRYVSFYTNPMLKAFTPPDADAPYQETYIFRINDLLQRSGYCTYDMS